MFKTKYYLLKASIGRNECAELFVGSLLMGVENNCITWSRYSSN